MMKVGIVTALMVAGAFTVVPAQGKKPAAGKPVTYDVTITADGQAYTGTMELAVNAGKVTGSMNITKPGAITGKAAGTVKAGEMILDFPYLMVERKCEGQIAMTIKAPARTGPMNGTVAITGCGRDPSNKLGGTIDLKPVQK